MKLKFTQFIKFFWSQRHYFTKYFIVGLSGVFLDIGSLIVLKERFGFSPTTAIVINQIFLLTYIFLLNKYWSFKDKTLPHRQIVRFLILASGNYLFAVLLMYIFNHWIGFDYRLVRLGSIALMVTWNFFLYKFWVYKT